MRRISDNPRLPTFPTRYFSPALKDINGGPSQEFCKHYIKLSTYLIMLIYKSKLIDTDNSENYAQRRRHYVIVGERWEGGGGRSFKNSTRSIHGHNTKQKKSLLVAFKLFTFNYSTTQLLPFL